MNKAEIKAKNYLESYKMQFRSHKTYRPCLGLLCDGKKFWSYNHARLCDRCRKVIKGVSNDELRLPYFC